MSQNTLNVVQIILACFLIVAILLQARGTGLGGIFGGAGAIYRTKRGIEKFLFRATILLCILFFATVFLNLILFK